MKCIILTFLSKVPSKKNKFNVGRIVSGNSGLYWSMIFSSIQTLLMVEEERKKTVALNAS